MQEKKISTKINYDVLRSLNMDPPGAGPATAAASLPLLPETPGAAAVVAKAGDTPGNHKSDRSDAVAAAAVAPAAASSGRTSTSSSSSSVFGVNPLKTPRDVNKVFAPSLGATSTPLSAKAPEVNDSRTESERKERAANSHAPRVPNQEEGAAAETVVPEPIVESGPVELAAEDEDEEALEEVEDDSCLSAAQLLSQHRGDDYEDDYYEDDDYY